MKRIIVGITGKAGAGKDTVADFLWVNHDFSKFTFAYPLKLCVMSVFGLSDRTINDRSRKEVDHPAWGISPRRMMQRMGDAIREEFGEDIFVRHMKLLLDNCDDDVVISDVRFPEEAELIRSMGGVIIKLERGAAGLDGASGGHRSEAGLPDDLVDVVIPNNGTKDALFAEVVRVLELKEVRFGEMPVEPEVRA